MKELVIDRTRWYRGKGGTDSRLLRPQDGTMCCLGFYSLACGLGPADIEGEAFPSDAGLARLSEFGWLIEDRLDESQMFDSVEYIIGKINDSESITDEWREAKLIELFAEHGGIAVTFIN